MAEEQAAGSASERCRCRDCDCETVGECSNPHNRDCACKGKCCGPPDQAERELQEMAARELVPV